MQIKLWINQPTRNGAKRDRFGLERKICPSGLGTDLIDILDPPEEKRHMGFDFQFFKLKPREIQRQLRIKTWKFHIL